MGNFKVIHEIFSGKIDKFINGFETKVDEYLNNGWKLINCCMEGRNAYAYMQKG